MLVAWATAAELPNVDLGDALALVLLALDHDAPRFDKAAVRWHSRLCREVPLTLDEAQLALSALRALARPFPGGSLCWTQWDRRAARASERRGRFTASHLVMT